MSFLEIAGKRQAIPDGESVIGSGASADVRLEGEHVGREHAILRCTADGQVAIRRASDTSDVLVNGVRLGPQPTPLLHGDKVTVGPHELFFVDERRGGSTQYIQAVTPSALADAAAAARQVRPGKPTAGTGGRLVSLTDGREYAVKSGSLVMGRDAGADVVVTSKEVSRRHCEVLATPKGYVIVDNSTNGTFVNRERVQGQRLLARADVIRLGDHEFRFYADLAAEAPPAPPAPAPPVAAAPPPPPAPASPQPPPAEPAAGAEQRLRNTLLGVPGVRPPVPDTAPAAPPPTGEGDVPRAATGALAYLVIRSGQLKGQRMPIRTPNVNIGRAEYNDIVLPDDSVSTTHAKIQRREGIWMLVDLDSTNGCFVDGERVSGDAPLAPGALVRLGEVRGFFEPADDGDGIQQGGSTRLLQAFKLPTER